MQFEAAAEQAVGTAFNRARTGPACNQHASYLTPMDRNVLVQDGPAKDKDGRVLSDITNRVPGGGGSGMIVRDAPPNLEFGAPGSSGRLGEARLICGYVGGELISCYYEVLAQ